MSTELTIKKGRGVPKDAEMAEAELALDLDDGTLYSKLGDGLVHALNEAPDADNYGHWKLQVDYGTPYQVVSGATANFEGTNGIKVTRTGDTVTIDGSELDLDEDADNYQYWTYKINGFNTTNVLSTQLLDFQSGDGIDIAREGYGIKISATGGGGGGSAVHIGDTPPDSPEEGQQWMEVPASGEATMWIYDGGKWLQHPSGKDGAPGADGNIADATTNGVVATWNDTAKQWTPNPAIVVDLNSNLNGLANADFANYLATTVDAVAYGVNTDARVEFYGSEFSNNEGIVAYTKGGLRAFSIDSTGNATFPAEVIAKFLSAEFLKIRGRTFYSDHFGIQMGSTKALLPTDSSGSVSNAGESDIGSRSYPFKDIWLAGSVYPNGGNTPLASTRDLIETLSTLRNATKDETTIKGLRDAIGNAVGGLIEKFEAMEAVTQEISDE